MSTDHINKETLNKEAFNKKPLNKKTVFLRQAEASDIDALEQLLNRCYRQAEGWTNEADLIGGIRTTKDELLAVIADPKHYVFIYPKTTTGERDGKETGELLGCIATVDSKVTADIDLVLLTSFILADRKKHELQARIDELENIEQGYRWKSIVSFSGFLKWKDNRLKQLKGDK